MGMEKKDSTQTSQAGGWKAGPLGIVEACVLSGARALMMTWATASVVLQGSSMVAQSYRESARAPFVASMRTEMEWLEASGLAPKARVGVAAANRLGHGLGSQSEAAMTEETLWGGWSVVGPIANALPSMKWAGWNPGETQYLISAPDRDLEAFEPRKASSGLWESKRESVLPSVLRHEAGHALAYENKWGPGRPAAWSESAGRVGARVVKSQMEGVATSSMGQGPWQGDWRGKWMAGLWNESFADAFSCVSAAKKGESKSCAMSRHARRIFATGPRDASSIVVAASLGKSKSSADLHARERAKLIKALESQDA